MTHTNLAKETLLQFMQAMYSWERKATRNLRNQAYKEMLKDELATIFNQFCTSKKPLRAREVSLSVRFPFDYKLIHCNKENLGLQHQYMLENLT